MTHTLSFEILSCPCFTWRETSMCPVWFSIWLWEFRGFVIGLACQFQQKSRSPNELRLSLNYFIRFSYRKALKLLTG